MCRFLHIPFYILLLAKENQYHFTKGGNTMKTKKNTNPVIHFSDLFDSIEAVIVVDDVREYGPGEIKELYEKVKEKDSSQKNGN